MKPEAKFVCRAENLIEKTSSQLMRLLGLALVAATLCGVAVGQVATADLTGTATDSTGAAIPGATVTLTNVDTHVSQVAKSNGEGGFGFTFLQPGHYSVRVESPGFKTFEIPDIGLQGGDHGRADAAMQPGAVGETVKVTSELPLLQADSSTMQTTIGQQAAADLPLPTRNLTSLITFTAGANEASNPNGLSSGGRPNDRRQTSSFSVNGQQDTLNNELIDGTDNNERVIGTIGVKPPIDAIEEVTVQTNEYAPEVGRAPGGIISVLTKSGTDSFHGSGFEFIKNTVFDARNPFNPTPNELTPFSPKAALRQNDFGGSVGGPIFRGRTFFFVAYEGFTQTQGKNPVLNTVPTLAEQEAGPEGIKDADPATAPYPVDPIAVNYFKFYPLPNTGGANATQLNYVYVPVNTQTSNIGDARVDHRFNSSNSVFGRFTMNYVSTYIGANMPSVDFSGLVLSPGNGPNGYSGPALNTAYSYQLNYIHVFTPNFLLELKAAYDRVNNTASAPNQGTNAATAFGFPTNVNYGPASSALPVLTFSNSLSPLGDSEYEPLQNLTGTYQYYGNLSYTHGRHTMKFGAVLIRRQVRVLQSISANSNYTFSVPGDSTTSAGLASFLVGAFTTEQRTVNLNTPDYRVWEPGFYAQDTWRVNEKLTLNYGARYDIFTPFTEAHNYQSNFDPFNEQLYVAGENGVGATAGVQTDYSNFSPRVGFAYSVLPGTVVRGGFGISFYPGTMTTMATMKNIPFNSTFNPNCGSDIAVEIEAERAAAGSIAATQVQPLCSTIPTAPTRFDQGMPVPTVQNINSPGLSFTSVDRHLKNGMAEQFNLMVERQFHLNVFTIAYVGALGRHVPAPLYDMNVPNPALYTPAELVLQNRPTFATYPNIGSVKYWTDGGTQSYHALQLTFQRRYSNGLSFQANYTFSHDMDNVSSISNEGASGFGNMNPYDYSSVDYGNSDLDLRQRTAFTASYASSWGKGWNRFSRALLTGYQFNIVYIWNTGNPFTVTDASTTFSQSVFKSGLGGGTDRPMQIANPILKNPGINHWFNTTAFVQPAPGVIGNERRNQLYGPHFQHLDVSIFRNFRITSRVSLQLRAESFNLTNTPAYYIAAGASQTNAFTPSCSYTLHPGAPTCTAPAAPNSAFGKITQTNPSYSPRNLQFAAKITF
jgi:outer membrane receptor protein involved in Fe transport